MRYQSKNQPHSSSFLSPPEELSPMLPSKSTFRDKSQDRLKELDRRGVSKEKSFKKYFSYRKPTSGADLTDSMA